MQSLFLFWFSLSIALGLWFSSLCNLGCKLLKYQGPLLLALTCFVVVQSCPMIWNWKLEKAACQVIKLELRLVLLSWQLTLPRGSFIYLLFCLFILIFKFSITVYLQYYFALASGIQHNGQIILYFTKCPPDISSTHHT